MGKILTKGLKNRANVVFNAMEDKFSSGFENNKTVLRSLELPYSKRVTNVIAGFVTRSVKRKETLAAQEAAALAAAKAAQAPRPMSN
ncbi:MAG: hypothetical protein GOV15_00730 [Candidatus Diapherotrites archaeon]|nr:hypothetical protein [Candidatus Diapherotrites archaeon]